MAETCRSFLGGYVFREARGRNKGQVLWDLPGTVVRGLWIYVFQDYATAEYFVEFQ